MKLRVRPANENDVEEASKLVSRLKALNAELDPNFSTVENLDEVSREYVRSSLNDDNVLFLVAEDEDTGTLVGILRALVVDRVFYKPRRGLLITDLYVDPRYRRRRVGSLLLQKIEDEARKLGISLVMVVYPSGNIIADDFYEKKGFKLLQVEKYKNIT